MNSDRRKELAKVFFDLAKYLLTTVAVGGFLTERLSWWVVGGAVVFALTLLAVAYFTMPTDKE